MVRLSVEEDDCNNFNKRGGGSGSGSGGGGTCKNR
jgi:hypothetical protein